MAAQNLNDPSIHESPSILLSPSSSQSSESLSSKFLRKSKFLMKPNVKIENSVNCSPSSTNDLLPMSESSDNRHHQQIAAESVMKPITHPLAPTIVVQHSKDSDDKTVTLRAAKDLQNVKLEDAAFSTPLSPINHSPPSPLMEIIPPPLSYRLQATTPLEIATAASSNANTSSTQELQSLSEIQHTPCRLAISILAFSCPTQI